jgi:hypothetical protein
LGKETLVIPGRPPLDEAAATEIIVRFVWHARALHMTKTNWRHLQQHFRMLCAPKKQARADKRCRRMLLRAALRGATIPKAYQTRLCLMLMLGHISSLSFELGERHRLITIWLNTLVRLQVRTGIGCEVNLRWLIAPLQTPKAIPKEAGKAFHQVLQSVEHGYDSRRGA